MAARGFERPWRWIHRGRGTAWRWMARGRATHRGHTRGHGARTGADMSAEQGTSSVTSGPRGMRRKTLQTAELVQTSFLPGEEERLPLVISPTVDNVDLVGWCTSHAEEIERYLDRYGAILFRGFPI